MTSGLDIEITIPKSSRAYQRLPARNTSSSPLLPTLHEASQKPTIFQKYSGTFSIIKIVVVLYLCLCILDIATVEKEQVPTYSEVGQISLENLRNSIPMVLARKILHEESQIKSGLQEDQYLHVVQAASGAYLKPMLASMNSIATSTTRPLYFHLILSPGDTILMEEQLTNLFPNIPIELVEFNPERVKSLIRVWQGVARHSSELNHARMFLPDLFPNITKMIYLDPDTIIVEDIGRMFDEFASKANETNFLGAVVSKQGEIFSSTYKYLVNCEDAEVSSIVTAPMSKYFNAGVLVTDLSGWRREGIREKLEDLLNKNTKRRMWNWGSQAPLTLIFYGRWIELDPTWNERRMKFLSLDEFSELAPNTKLYHFAGEEKPWKTNGKRMWHLWCQYYPRKEDYWFCKEGTYLNLMPTSPLDFNFVSTFWKKSIPKN